MFKIVMNNKAIMDHIITLIYPIYSRNRLLDCVLSIEMRVR